MHQRRTLVVVDVQTEFEATWPQWLKSGVMREVEEARFRGDAIIMLEFFSVNPPKTFGPTYPDLVAVAAAGNQAGFTMRAKALEDGSERVLDACTKMGFPTNLFRICGVNTHACILATVVGLARTFPACLIEVATYACNDYRGNNWSAFPRLPNVLLLT